MAFTSRYTSPEYEAHLVDERINKWLKDTSKMLNLSNCELKDFPIKLCVNKII